ncbi:hypothetical protein ACFLSI_00265 [Bacteroidota bacterium]
MENKQISQQLLFGSICAIIGTISYILAVSIQLPPSIAFILVTFWPMTAIISAYVGYKYFALTKQSLCNQLSFLFAVIAFVLVYIMVSVQIGLKAGIGDLIANAEGNKKEMLSLILASTEWVHLGIDLAWDMFLGAFLILLSIVIYNHPEFKIWWSIPMALLGISVIVINLYTFPYTPESQGIIDVGPFIGSFMIIWAIRIIKLSVKLKKLSGSISSIKA